jgi:hypothetical protein
VDVGAFLAAMVVILLCAALVFLVLVPRTRREPGKAPKRALLLSLLAVPLALFAAFLGFPLDIAGGGITLGLRAPIVMGLLVLAVGIVATAFPLPMSHEATVGSSRDGP